LNFDQHSHRLLLVTTPFKLFKSLSTNTKLDIFFDLRFLLWFRPYLDFPNTTVFANTVSTWNGTTESLGVQYSTTMLQEEEQSKQNNGDSQEVVMPPPAPVVDRKMNDTTMPPPRFSNAATKPQQQHGTAAVPRKTAVNVRSRGPRFGLHDWKRLLAASKDLAQLKGQPPRRDIPLEEIKRHNKNHDAWIILRGRVYNIGPYLPYHPGGIEICKHVLGKDATSMFDKYHRWVNIDGLIGPLMIGTVAMGGGLARTKENAYSVVPPKESHLTNAPRVPVQQVASSTTLLPNNHDDEEEEDLILPPPSQS